MEIFNASIGVDRRLWREDILGSLAHVKMLAKVAVLTDEECQKISSGLGQIREEFESGKFVLDESLEDIHMAVESRLYGIIGDLAGKLHTARSRNDQVALDVKLFVRSATQEILDLLQQVSVALVDLAEKNTNVILPGYTHLQRAQPVLLAHHLLAYFEMFQRDRSRFKDNLERLSECPLGAGALAGTTFPIDRHFTARELGFSEPTSNSLDTVADRDFVLDFLSASATLMMHLSRLAEEWVLWNTQEFGFIILPQEFCTGSSMMPQKVNPDALELIRGKTGRVYGNLLNVLTTMKALPLSYNKDMQEDKEPLFDTADTLSMILKVLAEMLPLVQFNPERMRCATKEGFVLATDVADYLVGRGLPFRQAHAVVGQLVQAAIKKGCGLEDFQMEELKNFSPLFADDVRDILSVEKAVSRRQSFGGTAQTQVEEQIKCVRAIFKNHL